MNDETINSLSLQAQRLYNSSDFPNAINCLNNIKSHMGDKIDIRVQQNLIVAKSAFNRFVDLPDLFCSLMIVAKGGSESSKSLGNTTQDPDRSIVEHLLSIVGPDSATILFNMASLYFHNHKYEYSKQILEILFSHVEAVGEALSLRVCFLLLEVLLRLFQLNATVHTDSFRELFESQTSTILKQVEKFCHSNEDVLSGDHVSLDSQLESSILNGKSKQSIFKNLILFRIRIYNCRINVILNQLKNAKKEIKIALEMYQRELRPLIENERSSSSSSTSTSTSTSTNDIQSVTTIQSFLACPLALGAGGPYHSLEHQNQLALYLKANIEYLKHNYRKSLKLLTSCHRKEGISSTSISPSTSTWMSEGPVYFNNVACLYFRLQRYHASTFYFHKALPNLIKNTEKPALNIASNGLLTHKYTADIVYNTGLSLLVSSHPLQAFRCFESTSTLLNDRPHLWIRMAECCINYDIQRREETSRTKSRLFYGVIGKGRSRHIQLRHVTRNDDMDEEESSSTEEDIKNLSHLLNNNNDHTDGGDGTTVAKDRDKDMQDNENSAGYGNGNESLDGGISSGNGTGTGRGVLALEQRCSIRRAVRYLGKALHLIRKMKSNPNHNNGNGSTMTDSDTHPNNPNPNVSSAIASNTSTNTSTTSVMDSVEDPPGTGAGTDQQDTNAGAGAGGVKQNSSMWLRPQTLEEHVLLQLTFVHLRLGDPICALNYGKELLSLSLSSSTTQQGHIISSRTRFLAQTYCVEALCTLGRVSEAADILEHQPSPGDDELLGCPVSSQWGADGTPVVASGNLARAIALVNRGSCLCLQGRLDSARAHMEAALKTYAGFTPALQGLLYVLLRQGHSMEALQVIRTLRS